MARRESMDFVLLTWNSARTLPRALESIPSERVNQLIVVDRISVDGTPGIVRSYFPSAKVISSDSDLGKSRSLAIDRVSTPTFFFIDSDVVLSEGYVDRLERYLGDDVGAVQGYSVSDDPLEKELDMLYLRRSGQDKLPHDLSNKDYSFTGATLVRTSVARGIDLSAYPVHEDYGLLISILRKGFRFVSAPVPFTHLAGAALDPVTRAKRWGAVDRTFRRKPLSRELRELLGSFLFGWYAALALRSVSVAIRSTRVAFYRLLGYLTPGTLPRLLKEPYTKLGARVSPVLGTGA